MKRIKDFLMMVRYIFVAIKIVFKGAWEIHKQIKGAQKLAKDIEKLGKQKKYYKSEPRENHVEKCTQEIYDFYNDFDKNKLN